MPLRNFIKAYPESISDMLVAADDRYQEAEELLLQHKFDGCVYLLGYSAEMWLKVACLRLRSLGPNVQVKAALGPLKSWMRQTAPQVPQADFHDLAFLAAAVAQLRIHQGRPLPLPVATELQSRVVNGLYPEWLVDMRYRRSGLAAVDAWAALVNTWWLKQNWMSLI
ncbi:MAG TPA: hypothetical protein VIM11_24860 [Tepidisphaeraceae bacterium]|jgi:hypothetical protein